MGAELMHTLEKLFSDSVRLSVTALCLLDVREHLRAAPDQPAQKPGIEALEW
jgi:hypothetical protein